MGRGHSLLYHFVRTTSPSLFSFLCSDLSGVTSNPYSYPLEWNFYFQVKLSRYIFQTNTVFLLRNSAADVRQIICFPAGQSVRLHYIFPCRKHGSGTCFVKGSVQGWGLKQRCHYPIYHTWNPPQKAKNIMNLRILEWNIIFKNPKLLWIFKCWQLTEFYFYLHFQYWCFI